MPATRQLLEHLQAHLREDWNPRYYATTLTLLITALAVPWVIAVVCHCVFHRRLAVLRDPRLWLAALAALASSSSPSSP